MSFTQDGLYVLLKPEKKKRKSKSAIAPSSDAPKIPAHLAHYEMKNLPTEACPWSLSGPQFPQPTAIQQRYCYPKGDAEYASRKGGALWTMYGRDGQEDLKFRLLHVYFSAKRAGNKGVALSAEEKKVVAQQSFTASPKKRRKTAAAESRMKRSPWQERQQESSDLHQFPSLPASVSSSPMLRPEDFKSGHMISGPPTRMNTGYASAMLLDRQSFLPPPSPCSSRKRKAESGSRTEGENLAIDSTYVSPYTTELVSLQGSGGEEDDFSARRFHPIPSFDEKGHGSSAFFSSSPADASLFRDMLRNPDDRKAVTMYSHRRAARDYDGQNHNHYDASFSGLTGGMLSDDDLALQPNADRGHKKPSSQEDPCTTMYKQLDSMQKSIQEFILSNPPSDQPALVSMVSNWAKTMTRSPLLPPKVKEENGEDQNGASHIEHVSNYAKV